MIVYEVGNVVFFKLSMAAIWAMMTDQQITQVWVERRK